MKSENFIERVSNIIKVLDHLVQLSDYEKQLVQEAISALHSTPSIQAARVSKVEKMIKCSDDISYILLRLKKCLAQKKDEHDLVYNRMFTILVKKNRPSAQAIESEIYMSDQETYEKKKILNDYEFMIEYLNSILASIAKYIIYLRNE